MTNKPMAIWRAFFKEHLADLGVGGVFTRRAADRVADLVMDQGFKLLDQFAQDLKDDSPKGRKRRRILDAATELFVQQGYRKTSVDEVARLAGVSKGTVYLYFDGKSDLLLEAIAREKAAYLGDTARILRSDRSDHDKLRDYLASVFVLVNAMPLVSRLISGDPEMKVVLDELDLGLPVNVMDLQAAFFGHLIRRATGRERLDQDAINQRARVITALMYASSFMADETMRGGLTIEQFARTLADMLIDGLVPEEGK